MENQVPRLVCGCIDNSSLPNGANNGLFGQTCPQHTRPRFVATDSVRQNSDWYRENTCPCCGRVNGTGLSCPESNTVTCSVCGLHTCCRLNMGHYYLKNQTGLICPTTTHKLGCKPRTSAEKRLAALIASEPSRDASLQDFQGKIKMD